ncbi:MAG TPA: FMN-dependent NADH-azoreductase [Planctomycetes bacterium]|nr:FMN-dependent NADH-azoreductase [Planctomycetota bacterium]
MGRLLYILASPRTRRSHSAAVANAFIEAYKQYNPNDEITKLNVFEESLPAFDGPAVEAKYTILHAKEHSQAQLNAWKGVEGIIEQFKSADKYLLAVPMWNFSIPYRLKQYIDLLVQPGYTFTFSQEKGYEGLVVGKPLLVVYARGGRYPPGSDAEAFDLQIKYVEQIFRFIGFEDIKSIIIEPTLQAGPAVAETNKNVAIEEARKLALDF